MRSRNAVLPEPGLETRLMTQTPASWKRSRSTRAAASFLFRTFCGLRPGAAASCLQFQSGEFQFRPLHYPARPNFRIVRNAGIVRKRDLPSRPHAGQ